MAKRVNGSAHGGGKRGRKIGNKRKWCEVYRARNKRLINKIRKVTRHLKNNPHDIQTKKRLKELTAGVI